MYPDKDMHLYISLLKRLTYTHSCELLKNPQLVDESVDSLEYTMEVWP